MAPSLQPTTGVCWAWGGVWVMVGIGRNCEVRFDEKFFPFGRFFLLDRLGRKGREKRVRYLKEEEEKKKETRKGIN